MENQKPGPTGLRISNDPMYRLLREGCIKEFNVKRAGVNRSTSRDVIYEASICAASKRTDWILASLIFARPIFAESISAMPGSKERASMRPRSQAPTSPAS